MSMLVTAVLLSIMTLFSSVYFVYFNNKQNILISSVFTSVGIVALLLIADYPGQLCLLILPIFLIADFLLYTFTNSIENNEPRLKNDTKEKVYLSVTIWSLLIFYGVLAYKFVVSGDSSWTSEIKNNIPIDFKDIGALLWGEYFFVTVLLSLIMLLVGVGSLLMVRSREGQN